jgi:ABC-type branched-subunit amino acid transport system substrate-binding protein
MAGALSAGGEFAGLQVERLIAAGGMGEVWLARDETLNRRVALKVVAPALAADPRYRDRFLREARLAASLEHPAIVPVYAAGESDGELFLAMRFVDGGTLADRLAARGPLPPAEVIRLLAPVADALDVAHAAGLVHRDVKPGNVLLQGETALLADFGLARPISGSDDLSQLEGAGVTGTVGYVAPEQLEGDVVAGPADQYALACVLFECLTGQAPYRRPNDLATVYAHLTDPPPSAVALRKELPRQVDAVLARALAKRPSDRYPSCGDLVGALFDACGLRETQRPRSSRTAGLVGAALVVLAVLAGVALLASRGGGGAAHVAGDGVVVLDPVTLQVKERLPAGVRPTSVALGGGSTWVLNTGDNLITRISSDGRQTTPINPLGRPFDLAYGYGALWVTTGQPPETLYSGGVADTVVRVDPAGNAPTRWVGLPATNAPLGPSGRAQIAVGLNWIWVVNADGSIVRVDPRHQNRVRVISGADASAIAVGDGQLWMLGTDALRRIDPDTMQLGEPIQLSKPGSTTLAVGSGAIWVANPDSGEVIRVDPDGGGQTTIPTAFNASTVSFSGGRVWVADALGGEVLAIDPYTSRVVGKPIAIGGGAPQTAVQGGGGVWIPTVGSSTPVAGDRIQPAAGDVQDESCSAVFQARAGGRPQFLITSMLPLHGFNSQQGLATTSAIRFVLQEHGFRAGKYTIGYQSCEGAGPSGGGPDPAVQCKAMASKIASAERVVGVIGAWQSICTEAALPQLNDARPGPIAMISPSSTKPDLTTSAANFPSGSRSFARVIATEDDQGRADAQWTKRLGVHRVYVLDVNGYGFWYPPQLRDAFMGEAQKVGLAIAGQMTWDPDPHHTYYEAIARRVSRAGADAVFLVSFSDEFTAPATGLLIRALRAELPSVQIISPDAILPTSALRQAAGPAANGMYVSSTSRTDDQLSALGRQWAQRFATTQPRGAISQWSPLAAQTTEVLLDAIARSDGSRESVSAQMMKTTVPERDSLIGPFAITPTGDIDRSLITILQVGRTATQPTFNPDFQGAALVASVPVAHD